jgi:hypothetical protein
VLFDSFFDEPEALSSNQAIVNYLATLAAVEGLEIAGAVGSLNVGEIGH